MLAQAAVAPPPAGSAGFPSAYPYAFSAPLPSALLRPLQQYLYDTEVFPAAGPPNELVFFQRQLGQTTTFTGVTKTEAETNLQQPGQLANPLEFSVFGFLFEVEPATTIADFGLLYATSAFIFTYTGNRVYLSIPLQRIPQGVSPEGFSALDAQAAPAERTTIHNGVELRRIAA